MMLYLRFSLSKKEDEWLIRIRGTFLVPGVNGKLCINSLNIYVHKGLHSNPIIRKIKLQPEEIGTLIF